MHEFLVATALGSIMAFQRLPSRCSDDDTHRVVGFAANIFVVTTARVLGLMRNSAKKAFEAVDRNVHAFATAPILLDRSLRFHGPEATVVRVGAQHPVRPDPSVRRFHVGSVSGDGPIGWASSVVL